MLKKNRILVITGAKGQLGSFLVLHFQNHVVRQDLDILDIIGIDVDDVDIRDVDAVQTFFSSVNANALHSNSQLYVIHCAAATNTSAIEEYPTDFYAANCLGSKNVALASKHAHAKLIFISTDYVFSENSNYAFGRLQEFPVNQYGLQKLIAEQFVKEAYADNPQDLLIFRSSWMFGNSANSFVEKFLANVFRKYAAVAKTNKMLSVTEKAEVEVADDAYGKPTPVWYIAEKLASAILLNRFGEENAQNESLQISRFDWAQVIWGAFIEYRFDKLSVDKNLLIDISKMKEQINIVPVPSSRFGSAMHHPDLVKTVENTLAERASDNSSSYAMAYAYDTIKYVDDNIECLVGLATQALNLSC